MTFDLLTSKFIGSSTDHDQSSYQVQWLSPINFSRYWADMVFTLNATVTLTFDLVTSKFIWVIYWVWPIFLPSTMNVTHKLFKILSGHGFCIKCYCDLDLGPSDLKIFRGHLQYSYQVEWLALINFCKILSGHVFCIKSYCDLDLWPTDLKMYRDHLLSMANLPTKYHAWHS